MVVGIVFISVDLNVVHPTVSPPHPYFTPPPQMLLFESYRDAIQLLAAGLTEKKGLEAAQQKNVELRAKARALTAAALGVAVGGGGGGGGGYRTASVGLLQVQNSMPAGRGCVGVEGCLCGGGCLGGGVGCGMCVGGGMYVWGEGV